jgi:hypothetical protein
LAGSLVFSHDRNSADIYVLRQIELCQIDIIWR